MKKRIPKRPAKPADLDALLNRDVERVRKTVDRLPSGRTLLAGFLGIRLSEVSRYFTSGERRRNPQGRILSGMLEFQRRNFGRRNLRRPAR